MLRVTSTALPVVAISNIFPPYQVTNSHPLFYPLTPEVFQLVCISSDFQNLEQ